MPLRHVSVLLHHMPRLQSEESFHHVDEIAVGTGSMPTEEAKQVIDGWRYDVTDDVLPPVREKRTRQDTLSLMSMLGVETVEG